MPKAVVSFLILLIAGCAETSWLTKFHNEFDWNKPIYRTKLGIQVAPPTWMAEEDIPKLLDYVDFEIKSIVRGYPWAKTFDFGTNVIWVHDSPVAFVAGTPAEHAWARGWAVGKYLVVAFGIEMDDEGRPNGPAQRLCTPALVHEVFHAILRERYGYADPGHCYYFPGYDVKTTLMTAQMSALMRNPIKWSAETEANFRAYKYMPWLIEP